MKATGVPLVLLVLFYLSFSVLQSSSKPSSLCLRFPGEVKLKASTKTPEADFGGFFPQTSLFNESISNTTTIDIDDKFQCSNNVDDNEHQGYDGSGEDNNEDINSDDIGSEEDDENDDENDTGNEMEKRAEEFITKLIYKESRKLNSGFEEDDENDITDNAMKKRAEEFIAKVKQKWRTGVTY
ncbi:hypothetical protein K2173_013280 [Erythroxylum novogranatense]|uniref:Uncharacterized protein n=1 Tax=Erythroxylum novogranatense TaxID=1862640 RepID=A0AAV8S9U1_9ROSI|nr:hypothetical protein K2173_013280 [Erythroxylum novogranatense]